MYVKVVATLNQMNVKKKIHRVKNINKKIKKKLKIKFLDHKINKFNKNYFKTRVKKTGYGFKNLD